MKRWKSPQAAAKHAERAAKEAEKARREKRNCRLMIGAWAILTVSLMVGDYFWLRASAKRKREDHQMRFHQKTNASQQAATNSVSPPTAKSPEKD